MNRVVACLAVVAVSLAGCAGNASQPSAGASRSAQPTVVVSPPTAPARTSPSTSPSASAGTVTRTLHLVARAPSDNPTQGHSSIQKVHFVVVSQAGSVVAQRDGNGDTAVTVPTSGFWSSAKEMGGPIGEVTVFAAAAGYRDAIELHVLISPSIGVANEVVVPMQPIVQGARNEPSVSDGFIHHLEIVALAGHYLHPKQAHPSASAS